MAEVEGVRGLDWVLTEVQTPQGYRPRQQKVDQLVMVAMDELSRWIKMEQPAGYVGGLLAHQYQV